jgi:hypothetical protein
MRFASRDAAGQATRCIDHAPPARDSGLHGIRRGRQSSAARHRPTGVSAPAISDLGGLRRRPPCIARNRLACRPPRDRTVRRRSRG